MANSTKRNTATVTWITYLNYGTYLQAYAMQHTLRKLGYENHIIDDGRVLQSCSIRKALGKIKRFILKTGMPAEVIRKFEKFKDEHLLIDNKWKTLEELSSRYDTFICGSDQIWSAHSKVRSYYFLGFTHKTKIAYAPSLGTPTLPIEYCKEVSSLLADFKAISVREESGAEALERAIGRKVDSVLDPTLLLNANEWNEIASPVLSSQEEYILCYFLTPNSWYMDYVKEYAIRHKMPLKILALQKEYRHYGDERLLAGPGEFLSYVRSAKKIFTDSFHASIFSLIYSKDFVTFKRFDDEAKENQNSRITDLFNKLDIMPWFVGKSDLDKIESLETPPFEEIHKKKNSLKACSIEYLKTALSI